jgi:hypothetical protein
MSELYWITRLDTICAILILIIVVSIAAMVPTFLEWVTNDYADRQKKCLKLLRLSFITFLLSSFLLIFVPTTKDALIIYGVGETIEYVKNNDKVKQLPDKVIDALDKYLEQLNKKD